MHLVPSTYPLHLVSFTSPPHISLSLHQIARSYFIYPHYILNIEESFDPESRLQRLFLHRTITYLVNQSMSGTIGNHGKVAKEPGAAHIPGTDMVDLVELCLIFYVILEANKP